MLIRIYTPKKILEPTVINRYAPLTGPKHQPARPPTQAVVTNCATAAACGDFQVGCVFASFAGNSPIRAIAYQVRLAALVIAFCAPRLELNATRNMATDPAGPHTRCDKG